MRFTIVLASFFFFTLVSGLAIPPEFSRPDYATYHGREILAKDGLEVEARDPFLGLVAGLVSKAPAILGMAKGAVGAITNVAGMAKGVVGTIKNIAGKAKGVVRAIGGKAKGIVRKFKGLFRKSKRSKHRRARK